MNFAQSSRNESPHQNYADESKVKGGDQYSDSQFTSKRIQKVLTIRQNRKSLASLFSTSPEREQGGHETSAGVASLSHLPKPEIRIHTGAAALTGREIDASDERQMKILKSSSRPINPAACVSGKTFINTEGS